MTSYIKSRITQGVFEVERFVSFSVGDKNYNLIVDKSDVERNCLAVMVIDRVDSDIIIDLPRETFTTGTRIRVPAEMVLDKPE